MTIEHKNEHIARCNNYVKCWSCKCEFIFQGYIKTSEKPAQKSRILKESFEPPTLLTSALTHISFYILMFLGYLSQALFPPKIVKEKNRDGYPPLFDRFASFYSRYVYRRIRDCWNYPICSVPGNEVVLKDRITNDNCWTFEWVFWMLYVNK